MARDGCGDAALGDDTAGVPLGLQVRLLHWLHLLLLGLGLESKQRQHR